MRDERVIVIDDATVGGAYEGVCGRVWSRRLQSPWTTVVGDVIYTCANGIAVMRNGVLVHVSQYEEVDCEPTDV